MPNILMEEGENQVLQITLWLRCTHRDRLAQRYVCAHAHFCKDIGTHKSMSKFGQTFKLIILCSKKTRNSLFFHVLRIYFIIYLSLCVHACVCACVCVHTHAHLKMCVGTCRSQNRVQDSLELRVRTCSAAVLSSVICHTLPLLTVLTPFLFSYISPLFYFQLLIMSFLCLNICCYTPKLTLFYPPHSLTLPIHVDATIICSLGYELMRISGHKIISRW